MFAEAASEATTPRAVAAEADKLDNSVSVAKLLSNEPVNVSIASNLPFWAFCPDSIVEILLAFVETSLAIASVVVVIEALKAVLAADAVAATADTEASVA